MALFVRKTIEMSLVFVFCLIKWLRCPQNWGRIVDITAKRVVSAVWIVFKCIILKVLRNMVAFFNPVLIILARIQSLSSSFYVFVPHFTTTVTSSLNAFRFVFNNYTILGLDTFYAKKNHEMVILVFQNLFLISRLKWFENHSFAGTMENILIRPSLHVTLSVSCFGHS